MPGPQGAMVRANAFDQATGRYTWIPPEHLQAQQPPPPRPLPESPYGPVSSSAPVGVPGESGAAGEPESTGAGGGGGFTAVNN